MLRRDSDEIAGTQEERRRALTILMSAARRLREQGDLLQAAGFMNRSGRLQIRLNESDDALATYQDALNLLKQTPNSTVNVDTLNGIGAALVHLSKFDEAEGYCERAISTSDQIGYVAGKADALLVRSECENHANHALAIQTAQQALTLWQSLGDQSGIARTYSSLGAYETGRNNLPEARQNTGAALTIWRELKIPHEQAEALISLGFIEQRKGAWQNALPFFSDAQALLDENAEPYKMGQINAGIAESLVESGWPESGLAKFQQAQEYYRHAESPFGVNAMSLDIGKTYNLLGQYNEAESTLQQVIRAAEQADDAVVQALGHDFLGRTYNAISDPNAALYHLEIALSCTQTRQAKRGGKYACSDWAGLLTAG